MCWQHIVAWDGPAIAPTVQVCLAYLCPAELLFQGQSRHVVGDPLWVGEVKGSHVSPARSRVRALGKHPRSSSSSLGGRVCL